MKNTLTVVLNTAVVVIVLLAAGSQPVRSPKVMVISPAWLGYPDPFAIIAAADGAIVATGKSQSVAVGFSAEALFVQRLYAAGALLVWDGEIAAGCAGVD